MRAGQTLGIERGRAAPVLVQIADLDSLPLEIVEDAAVVEVDGDESRAGNPHVEIVDDSERIKDLEHRQRAKPRMCETGSPRPRSPSMVT